MKRITVFFSSQSGRSEQLAMAFYQGVQDSAQVDSHLLRAADACVDDFLESDAWIIICPENFAAIAGSMKDLFDRVYYPFERADANRGAPYMLVLSAGNDGSFCEQQLQRVLQGMGAKKVQATQILHGEPSPAALDEITELGLAFATAVAMGAF